MNQNILISHLLKSSISLGSLNSGYGTKVYELEGLNQFLLRHERTSSLEIELNNIDEKEIVPITNELLGVNFGQKLAKISDALSIVLRSGECISTMYKKELRECLPKANDKIEAIKMAYSNILKKIESLPLASYEQLMLDAKFLLLNGRTHDEAGINIGITKDNRLNIFDTIPDLYNFSKDFSAQGQVNKLYHSLTQFCLLDYHKIDTYKFSDLQYGIKEKLKLGAELADRKDIQLPKKNITQIESINTAMSVSTLSSFLNDVKSIHNL
jgi:hypothetical protein